MDVAITGFDIAKTQHPGWYINTRDAAGRALARVPARDAFSSGAEVFPEQHGEPITRTALQNLGAPLPLSYRFRKALITLPSYT